MALDCRCDLGYHTTCLVPPLAAVPEGEWLCSPCVDRRDAAKEVEMIRRERDEDRRVASLWN